MRSPFEVLVSNVGIVDNGECLCRDAALNLAESYAREIRADNAGRAEFPVVVFCKGEIIHEIDA